MEGHLGKPVGEQVSNRVMVSWFCGMTRERERSKIVSGTVAEAVNPMEECGRGHGFDDLWDPATSGVRCARTTLREAVESHRLARAHLQRP
jgi:hypothetical protein